MPSLNPVREYQPLDPYNHIADNGPIIDLEANIALVNDVVDIIYDDVVSAIGNQGTLSNRLNVSINQDGSLITAAVDNADHSIAAHTDDNGYVRMTQDERDKLSVIADEATDLSLNVTTLSTTVLFNTGQVNFNCSDTVAWRVDDTGLYADVLFPLSCRHRHYYDIKPTPLNPLSPDYQNYTVTNVDTPYAAGSLRVYINGMKISHLDTDPMAPPDVYFPRIDIYGNASWVSLNYSEDNTNNVDGIITSGQFSLSTPITANDRLIVEFDVVLS